MIGCKGVYRKKEATSETGEKFKTRLVVKRYEQEEVVDYKKILSLVVKHTSLRVMLTMAVLLNLELEELDVKTMLINSEFDEEIYMEQLEGFKQHGKENLVCKLKRSLYKL